MQREENAFHRHIRKAQILQCLDLLVGKQVAGLLYVFLHVFIGQIFKNTHGAAEIVAQNIIGRLGNTADHTREAQIGKLLHIFPGGSAGFSVLLADFCQETEGFLGFRIVKRREHTGAQNHGGGQAQAGQAF